MIVRSKVIVAGVFLMIAFPLLSMDQDKTLAAQIANQSNVLAVNLFMPTAFSGAFEYAVSSFGSLKNTFANTISDEVAFLKLGWPLQNPLAQQGLTRTLSIYKQIITEKDHQKRQEFLNIIGRRTDYLKRAYVAITLPERPYPEGLAFATHCVKSHHEAMHVYLKNLFLVFIEEHKKASDEAMVNIQEFLPSKDGGSVEK